MERDNLRVMPLSAWISLAAIIGIAVLVGVVMRHWGETHEEQQAEKERAATPVVDPEAGPEPTPEPEPEGPKVDELLEALAPSTDPEDRIQAIETATDQMLLGEDRQRVVDAVVQAASPAAGPDVRMAALAAFAALGADGESAIAKLRAALEDPDERIRIAGLEAVAEIGPAAVDMMPSVLRSMEEESPDEVAAAALALGSLGRAAEEHVTLLETLLGSDPEGPEPWAAARALARLGDPGEAILLDAIQEGDPWAHYYAACALLDEDPDPSVTEETAAEAADALVAELGVDSASSPD